MATSTRPRNKDRVLRKILSALLYAGEATKPAGHAASIGYLKSKIWICAGTPTSTIPSGMLAKDIILDTTNDKVYRYITGTTYVEITATS